MALLFAIVCIYNKKKIENFIFAVLQFLNKDLIIE